MPFALASLAALFLSGCLSSSRYMDEATFKNYVSQLDLSGVTAQAATKRAEGEGFRCNTTGGVIQTAPQELVVVCQRRVSDLGCSQSQSIVLQLDWVGAQKPELAPGMRVKNIGTSAPGNPNCS